MPLIATGTRYAAPDKSLPVEERIKADVNFWWSQFQYGRWALEREWYRNILFYLDHQWIKYDEPSHRWRTESLKEWVPRPVTNRLASAVNTIRSAIMSSSPKFSAEPRNPESDLSVSGARAARDALDVLYLDSLFRQARRNMSSWLVLTGTGVLGVDFSTSRTHGTIFVPGERCLNCDFRATPEQVEDECPECHGRRWAESPENGEDLPRGKLLTTSWSPFETYLDSGVLELEEQPAIITARSYHVETARSAWDDQDIQPTSSAGSGQYYLASLATSSTSFRGVAAQDHVTIRRLHRKPCDTWPDGISATVTADGRVLEYDDKYKYRFKATDEPFYPLLTTVYDEVPGRFWGKTPVSSLVLKQAQRNRIESLFEMTLMTSAGPVWMIPAGSNPTKITGAPNIQITAQPVGGLLPQRFQGMGPDASVIQFLTKIDEDFEEIAQTFSVMKGKQPGGVRAFQAMRLLEERGMGRFGSVFENLEATYERWGVYSLELYRTMALSPLTHRSKNEVGQWTEQQFLKSDLSADIDIRVESGSVRPKSSLSKLDSMQRLQAMGVLDARYPEQRLKMLEESGMMSMIPGVERDTEAAMRENAEFLRWARGMGVALQQVQGPEAMAQLMQVSPPPVSLSLLVDEHINHFIFHRRFALTDEYRALPDQFKRWWEDVHMAGHLDAYQQLIARGGVPGQLPPLMPQQPTIAPPKPLDAASSRV